MSRHVLTALILDKRGRVVSVGRNAYTKTHPLQAKCAEAVGEPHRIYLHAEIDALVKLKDWSKAYKLIVTRFTKDGKPANAMPCKACQHALKLANITHVEYTT